MSPFRLVRFCQVLLLRPLRSLAAVLQSVSRWALAQGRRVRHKQSWGRHAIRPQSRLLEDPPGEQAMPPSLQSRWLARVLVASRPLGP
jgi:hypothetical protein